MFKRDIAIAWFVIFTMPLSGLSIDIFTPALPMMIHVFKITHLQSQLAISIYILAYGLTQLIWGPLSDDWGRSKTTLLGLYTYLLGTIGVFCLHTYPAFLACRFIQGVGVAASNSVCRAILVDLFKGPQFSRYTNYTTIAWSLSPIIAPVLGSYLISWYHWQSVFVALCIYCFILLIIGHALLYRTNPDRVRFNFKTVLGNFITILRSREFRATILLVILAYSFLTAFYVLGPFILQHHFAKSAIFYGHFAGLVGISWLCGNVVCRLTASRSNLSRMNMALLLLIIVVASGLVLQDFVRPLYLYMGLIFGVVFLASFMFPIGYISSLSLFPKMAGTASAIVGSVFWAGGGVTTVIAGVVPTNNILYVNIFYMLFTVFIGLTYLFYLPKGSVLKSS